MFDSFPHNSPGLVKFGAGRPAAKLSLGSGLTSDTWDSLFGAGTGDAVASQTRSSPSDCWTRQGWFRRCVDVRAKAVQTMPWSVYPEGVEPGDYDSALWNETMDRPAELDALQGLRRLFYQAEASLALAGRFYAGKVLNAPGGIGAGTGRLLRLAYWSPYTTTPDWSRGMLTFRRVVNGGVIEGIDPESVVWAWQPDPLVEVGPGSSDGNAAAHDAAVLAALSRFLGDHLDGGLIKMTVLAADDGRSMTPEQASDAASHWWNFLKGRNRRQGPPVLGAVKPHVIGEGLADLSNEVLTDGQREAIATAFGIPWSILASESANYATAVVEERGFYQRTAIPQCRLVADALNEKCLNEYGYVLRFEPERHEVMQQYELEKAEKVVQLAGRPVLTVEEARALLGMPEEPMSGELYVPQRVPQQAPTMPVGGDGAAVPVRGASLPLADRLDLLIGAGA